MLVHMGVKGLVFQDSEPQWSITIDLLCEDGLRFTRAVSVFILRTPRSTLVWLLEGSVFILSLFSCPIVTVVMVQTCSMCDIRNLIAL